VLINGQPAPVYYAQYDQINFQIPYETPVGEATVRIERGGAPGNAVAIRVKAREPRLIYFSPPGYYGIVRNASRGGALALPRSLGGVPAQVGDVLEIYALGIGQTIPPATSGAAASAGQAPGDWVLRFGSRGFDAGVGATPAYLGLTPGLVGLYQINVTVPDGSPKGDRVPLRLHEINAASSNVVEIAVE
jgi:uncharacterized protein (TIGR03437 family)